MDIPKKDSYSKKAYIVIFVLIIGLNVFAQEIQPVQVLIDSYRLPEKLTKETAKKAITSLKKALILCKDDALKSRIEYRIGMIYFKSDDFTQAIDSFNNLSQSDNCPPLTKLCSLNMAGRTYLVQAKSNKALEAFEDIIKFSHIFLTKDPNHNYPASVLKLAISAGFTRAEIYLSNQDINSAIVEYKNIISILGSNEVYATNSYAPLALDKISQLYLIKGNIIKYNHTASDLINKYPHYYRVPIIRLETEAVKILKGQNADISFSRGSFDAPARLIALIKCNSNNALQENVAVLMADLYSRYEHSYGGIMLGYHYAWLLDALGEKNRAVEVLNDISKQAVSINPDMPNIKQIISTLTYYAKCQQTILHGENNRYGEALEIIHSLKTDPNDAHMLTLSDSIEKGLQVLKREVSKDANDH